MDSISSRVVVRPRLKRIAPIPFWGGTFIAFNTGDNFTEPEWQAEPVEAATFSMRLRISDPALPIKLTFNVFGKRSVGCPLRAIRSPKESCNMSQKRSRSRFTDSMPNHDWDITHAAPKPTPSRIFSVPARRPNSWPAPWISGSNRTCSLTKRAPTPFGQGVGTAMVYPTLLAAISDVAHPEWRATTMGVYRFWRDLGYAIGALISGIVADLLGMRAAIQVVAALTLLSGLHVAIRMRETLVRQKM